MPLSKRQLGRLQTLYAQFARREIGMSDSREERLSWASSRLQRPVASFSDLTSSDANFLIDGLQDALGMKTPSRPRPRLDRDQARRAGIDGRRDSQEFTSAPQLASAADLEVIENYYARLGWERAQFDAWLRSPRSPLKHKSAPTITTSADSNRVRWALKGMLQHAGKWQDRRVPA
jgi:hypothetical protein